MSNSFKSGLGRSRKVSGSGQLRTVRWLNGQTKKINVGDNFQVFEWMLRGTKYFWNDSSWAIFLELSRHLWSLARSRNIFFISWCEFLSVEIRRWHVCLGCLSLFFSVCLSTKCWVIAGRCVQATLMTQKSEQQMFDLIQHSLVLSFLDTRAGFFCSFKKEATSTDSASCCDVETSTPESWNQVNRGLKKKSGTSFLSSSAVSVNLSNSASSCLFFCSQCQRTTMTKIQDAKGAKFCVDGKPGSYLNFKFNLGVYLILSQLLLESYVWLVI